MLKLPIDPQDPSLQALKRFQQQQPQKKIVFTNGCFDLLHPGHLTYLAQARALGGFLAVGINSDRSVRELKGPTRPVNDEHTRQLMLLGLKAVDAVFIFDEPTPLELIKFLRPQILVKGGDWPIEKMVGAQEVMSWGGEVKNLIFVDGFSTTQLIAKIKQCH